MRKEACLVNFVLLLILLFSPLGGNAGYADPYGLSGGMRNEGRTGVRAKLLLYPRTYTWVLLPPGASFDFPDEIIAMVLYSDGGDAEGFRVRIVFSDGSSTEITEAGETIWIDKKDRESLRDFRKSAEI